LPIDLLDQLDPRRFDAEAICRLLNQFDDLPPAEQDEHEFGIWGYAGLDDSQHVLSLLLRESHNSTCVVRDLDGSLVLIWEEPLAGRWHFGPLSAGNLADPEDSPHEGASELNTDLVEAIIASLPEASGRVMSF
jgi:hypothetical protein